MRHVRARGRLPTLLMPALVRRNFPDRQVVSLAYRLHRPAFAGEVTVADQAAV